MSEELMIREASPTLAGIKTGSLFNCAFNDRDELLADIRNMNHSLLEKGLCMLPLRFDEGSVLIYLFRAGLLRKDLADAESVRILKEAGYRQPAYPYCLTELGRRLNAKNGFPHEIGLFLGYPPEDVRGFIENRAKGSRLTGYWKVYGDVNAAKNVLKHSGNVQTISAGSLNADTLFYSLRLRSETVFIWKDARVLKQ